jgi:hypothetical protein
LILHRDLALWCEVTVITSMIMRSSDASPLYLEYFFDDNFPQAIIRDLVFGEMLSLSDIARLEVAAALYRLHGEGKVRSEDELTYAYNLTTDNLSICSSFMG